MGEGRNAYRILIGKPETKRLLGRPRRRWENNFKLYLKEILWEGVDWIDLAQDGGQLTAVVYTAMNIRLFLKCGECCDK